MKSRQIPQQCPRCSPLLTCSAHFILETNGVQVWRGTLWGKPVAVKLLPLLDVDERQLECLRREVAVLLHTTGECKQVSACAGCCWLQSRCAPASSRCRLGFDRCCCAQLQQCVQKCCPALHPFMPYMSPALLHTSGECKQVSSAGPWCCWLQSDCALPAADVGGRQLVQMQLFDQGALSCTASTHPAHVSCTFGFEAFVSIAAVP